MLSAGFRPFFLLAPLFAVLAAAVWVPVWHGHFAPELPVAAVHWHGHEMLFGYAAAVLAGFLLTAVPNWTGAPPVAGGRLLALVLVWVAARIAAWIPGQVPVALAAALDLAFLPLLGLLVGPAILRSSARRNGLFLVVLAVLTLIDLRYQLDALGHPWGDAGWSLRVGLGVFALLVALVGGRIVPAFTANWLKREGRDLAVRGLSRRDHAALAAVALTVAGEAAGLPEAVVGTLSAFAALLLVSRMVGWRASATLGEPILWVLHLGYSWLVVGFALKAAWLLGLAVPESAAIHALTVGAVGTMTIAVMSRAALGHSGRPLVAGRAAVAAYGLITLAALVRTLGALWAGTTAYPLAVGAAGALWIGAFVAFLIGYAPILLDAGRSSRSSA